MNYEEIDCKNIIIMAMTKYKRMGEGAKITVEISDKRTLKVNNEQKIVILTLLSDDEVKMFEKFKEREISLQNEKKQTSEKIDDMLKDSIIRK